MEAVDSAIERVLVDALEDGAKTVVKDVVEEAEKTISEAVQEEVKQLEQEACQALQHLIGTVETAFCFKCRQKTQFTVERTQKNKKESTRTGLIFGKCNDCKTQMSSFKSLKGLVAGI